MFKELGAVSDSELPFTCQLQNEVISLPIHTELTEEELKYITTGVLEAVNKLISISEKVLV